MQSSTSETRTTVTTHVIIQTEHSNTNNKSNSTTSDNTNINNNTSNSNNDKNTDSTNINDTRKSIKLFGKTIYIDVDAEDNNNDTRNQDSIRANYNSDDQWQSW